MKPTKQNEYTNLELETFISDLKKELATLSEIEGKHHGQRNVPVNESELRAFIMNSIESQLQVVIDKNHLINLPVSGMVKAQATLMETRDKIKQLERSLRDDEHKLWPIREKQKQLMLGRMKRKSLQWVIAIITIIGVCDGWFAYGAFRAAIIPKVDSIILAIIVALVISATHFLVEFIQKARTDVQRMAYYVIILALAFVFFYRIGQLRVDAYNSAIKYAFGLNPQIIETSLSGGVTGWGITISSSLLFLFALLLSIHFRKTDEERIREGEFDQISQEVNTLITKMQDTEAKIETFQKEASEEASLAISKYEYAIATENQIQAIARYLIEVYKRSNLRHRNDGLCPSIFSDPPTFKFKLFFDNVKFANYEKKEFRSVD